jgi:hypothetical protein
VNDLDEAIREALMLDEGNAPPAPTTWTTATTTVGSPRHLTPRLLTAAAALLLIVGLAALVVRWNSPASDVVPVAPPATAVLSQEERARVAANEAIVRQREALEAAAKAQYQALITQAAREQMVRDVVTAAADVGWTITLPTDHISQSSTDGHGVQYFEVRTTDSDVGQLLVSIRTGDAEAVAAGTHNRPDLLRSDGTASVYLGTDSPEARAVELFDGATIIYVRSESSNENARPLADLTTVALALNRIR